MFVAAGDAGSASCDDGGDPAGIPYSAQYGLSVNGLASTPYNTAVGGTDFNWCSLTDGVQAAPYWNSTNATNGSKRQRLCARGSLERHLRKPAHGDFLRGGRQARLRTIRRSDGPRVRLQLCIQQLADGQQYEQAQRHGVNCLSCGYDRRKRRRQRLHCERQQRRIQLRFHHHHHRPAYGSIPLVSDGWPKPTWQTGVSGFPPTGCAIFPMFPSLPPTASFQQLLPICVSAVAAALIATSSEPSRRRWAERRSASPAMAGVMALIDQKTGAAQGSPNAELYKLAAKQTMTAVRREASTTNGCYFNDIDTDTIAMPCDYGAYRGQPVSAIPCCTQSPKSRTSNLHGFDSVRSRQSSPGRPPALATTWPPASDR